MNTLQNKIIISARPISEEDAMKEYLSDRGARVIDFPMIEISASEIDDKIKDVFSKLNDYEWIVFTSKSGVDYFSKVLQHFKIIINNISDIKIAVVGKSTAEAVNKAGLTPTLISSGNTSKELVEELMKNIKNQNYTKKPNILLALGSLAADTLEKGLNGIADITRVDLYHTCEPKMYSKKTLEIINKEEYDIIAFSSPSQVINFMKITKYKKQENKFACIGSTTEKELLKYGVKPMLVAKKSDGISFASEIEEYLKGLKD